MKITKMMKENIKVVFGIVIGLSLGSVGVFASSVIASKDVSYENTLSNVANVQEAIEELYTLTKENEPNGHIIVENGVRYTGASPNNYVSFNGELWRIIGIFDGKIKIIKNESIGSKVWNSEQKNDWESSSLYQYLNTTYYDSLNATSKNMVENATWNTGGWNTSDVTVAQLYEYEKTVPAKGSTTTSVVGYIGLMSASDYGYASSRCYTGTQTLSNYQNCISTNWLKGLEEWMLTTYSTGELDVFYVIAGGYVGGRGTVTATRLVRPSLYLKANVRISGGAGTSVNPYLLEMN